MPACIVELGFMNSPTDNQLFDANIDSYAKAIGDAVLKTYESYGKDGADAKESVEDVPGRRVQKRAQVRQDRYCRTHRLKMYPHWMPPAMTGDLAAIQMMKTVR